MKGLLEIFSNSEHAGIDSYTRLYMDNIKAIHALTTDPKLLKSHINSSVSTSKDLLRFSLIFNDLSLLTPNNTEQLSMVMLQPEWFQENFGTPGLTIMASIKKLKELGLNPENPEVYPAYVFPHGNEVDHLIDELFPFLESGKLVIQPERALFHPVDTNENGGRNLQDIELSDNLDLNCWEIANEQISRPVKISQSILTPSQNALFDITIPYLNGVEFSDLAKIIEDEGDLISSLRVSIKQVIDNSANLANPTEAARDIIDPRIDSINRRFRSIINTQSFKIAGAAIGTVALAYTSVATAGLTSALATIGGAGGVGALGKAYSDYREKINEVKGDPFYFLWRCKTSKKI